MYRGLCLSITQYYNVFGDLTWPFTLNFAWYLRHWTLSLKPSMRSEWITQLTIRQMGSVANKNKSRSFDIWSDILKQKVPKRSTLSRAFECRFPRLSKTNGSEIRQGAECPPPPSAAGRVWRKKKYDDYQCLFKYAMYQTYFIVNYMIFYF